MSDAQLQMDINLDKALMKRAARAHTFAYTNEELDFRFYILTCHKNDDDRCILNWNKEELF